MMSLRDQVASYVREQATYTWLSSPKYDEYAAADRIIALMRERLLGEQVMSRASGQLWLDNDEYSEQDATDALTACVTAALDIVIGQEGE